LEKRGIPAVAIGTHIFEPTMSGAAKAQGFPHLRMSFLPQPTSGQPVELVLAKVNGDDPISGKPFLQQIYDQLTQPLTAEEMYAGMMPEQVPPRLVEPDTAENLEAYFHAQGWTDGLPIVLPTEERVAAMIAGCNRSPHEYVGKMQTNPVYPPLTYDVERVAVNAVMAGCKPEHFPVILALAASCDTALFSSTNSWTRMMVVNGPIALELGMNGSLGALGPWNQANAVLGRAWTIMSKNLGYAVPGVTYMGSQGNNFDYNHICIAENEEMLPAGWDPFHVMKGFEKDESVVSIFAGVSMRQTNVDGWQPLGFHKGSAARYVQMAEMSSQPGPVIQLACTLLIDPLVAANLARDFATRQDFMMHMFNNAYYSAGEFFRSYPSYRAKAQEGVEPYKTWLASPSDTRVPVLKYRLDTEYGPPEASYRNPALNVVVVGGGTNAFTWMTNFGHRESVGIDQFRPETPWAPIVGPDAYPYIPGY